MLTKSEIDLLYSIFINKGKMTFKKQEIYKSNVSFYKAISNLKKKEFVISTEIKNELDKRIVLYEITLKGIKLCKLIGE